VKKQGKFTFQSKNALPYSILNVNRAKINRITTFAVGLSEVSGYYACSPYSLVLEKGVNIIS
jgi:hypothetical protein